MVCARAGSRYPRRRSRLAVTRVMLSVLMPAAASIAVLDWLRSDATLSGAGGFAATFLMLVLLAFLLPPNRRVLVRGPAIFLVVSPFLYVISAIFHQATPVRPLLEFTALFFLLTAVGRTIFLLFEVVVLERIGYPLPKIALDVFQFGILLIVLLTVLHEAGVRPDTLFAGSAVVAAVLGFVLRDTIGNFVAGLTLQMQRPFDVGDWIEFDDKAHHFGKVMEINWRETRVITLDLAEVILPNGVLANACIRNFTKPDGWSRRSVHVVAPLDVPPNRVHEVILEALRDSYGVLKDPPPSVVTNAFTDRGIEYWVRFFTTEFGARDRVDGAARDRIWYALARHGIDIPVATHAVRLAQVPPLEAASPSAATDRVIGLLQRIDVFSMLPEPALRQLAGLAREVVFGRGEVILRQGDAGDSLYLIEKGEVVVTASPPDGQPPVEINRLGPVAFFGEMSLLTGATRSATVTASSECRLLVVDKPAFEGILRESPSLAEDVGRILSQRREALTTRLAGSQAQVSESTRDIFKQIREFFSLK